MGNSGPNRPRIWAIACSGGISGEPGAGCGRLAGSTSGGHDRPARETVSSLRAPKSSATTTPKPDDRDSTRWAKTGRRGHGYDALAVLPLLGRLADSQMDAGTVEADPQLIFSSKLGGALHRLFRREWMNFGIELIDIELRQSIGTSWQMRYALVSVVFLLVAA